MAKIKVFQNNSTHQGDLLSTLTAATEQIYSNINTNGTKIILTKGSVQALLSISELEGIIILLITVHSLVNESG